MGPCYSRRKIEQTSLFLKLQSLIENNDVLELEEKCQSDDFARQLPNINFPYFTIKDYPMTILGLAVWFSSVDCFKFLSGTLSASPEEMEKIFQKSKISGLDIICQRGSAEILELYLPIYEAIGLDNPVIEEVNESLDFSKSNDEIPKLIGSSYTPIQKACELGNMNLISIAYKYCNSRKINPIELDIDYQDELTGENCAIIACKTGNYSMIRFLHTSCRANFQVINKLGESPVQVLAANNKKKPLKEFHECLVYLINHIGVDFTYNHEEILLLIDNEKSVAFFERKLKEKGIEIDKQEIEEKNRLVKADVIRSLDEAKLDPYYGKDFNFKKLFKDVMKESEHEDVSFISQQSKEYTPFTSVLSELPQIK